MGGQQGIPRHFRSHLAVAQDAMGQHGEDRFAGGALDAPDGESAEANPRVMGVARQAPTLTAAGLVEELKAEGEEKGEDELDKRLGVVKELVVRRFIVEINGDRAVFACHFGGLAHVSSPCRWLSVQRRHGEGNPWQEQAHGERIGASPLNPMECGILHRSRGPKTHQQIWKAWRYRQDLRGGNLLCLRRLQGGNLFIQRGYLHRVVLLDDLEACRSLLLQVGVQKCLHGLPRLKVF